MSLEWKNSLILIEGGGSFCHLSVKEESFAIRYFTKDGEIKIERGKKSYFDENPVIKQVSLEEIMTWDTEFSPIPSVKRTDLWYKIIDTANQKNKDIDEPQLLEQCWEEQSDKSPDVKILALKLIKKIQNIQEVSQLLDIPESTLYNWIEQWNKKKLLD